MNIFEHIRKIHEHGDGIPGKLYYTGLRVKLRSAYHDTGNLHDTEYFMWYEYTFNHSSRGNNARQMYVVLYDYKAGPKERDWFDQKCTDLFKLGFMWSESSGTFSLPRIWSAYWEQVNRYTQQEWKEYIEAINEAILDHEKYSKLNP